MAGEGRDGVPRLAGLPADYIAAQLTNFASGARANDSMYTVSRQLAPAERAALAHYYAGLATPSNARPSLGGDIGRGATLALLGDDRAQIPSCFSCHGSSGFGVAPSFPAIAAQHPGYAAGRVAAIAALGKNANLMTPIAKRLNDADRRAVADYLATLPPTPAGVATARKER